MGRVMSPTLRRYGLISTLANSWSVKIYTGAMFKVLKIFFF